MVSQRMLDRMVLVEDEMPVPLDYLANGDSLSSRLDQTKVVNG